MEEDTINIQDCYLSNSRVVIQPWELPFYAPGTQRSLSVIANNSFLIQKYLSEK